MKNLLFGLIATVLFSFNVNAQSTFETAQYRGVMASFVEAARLNGYEKGTSQEDFFKNAFGDSKPSKEEIDFVLDLYNYLEKGTSSSEILCSYKGTAVNELLVKVKNGDSLFTYANETSKGKLETCSGHGFWHWLGCSLGNVVTILEHIADIVAVWCRIFPC